MSMVDRLSHMVPLPLAMPVAVSSTVDRQGFNALSFIATITAAGGELTLMHGDVTTNLVGVHPDDLLGTPASRALDQVGAARMLGYIGAKRFVRMVISGGGAVDNVWAILEEPALGPTPNPPNNEQLGLLSAEEEVAQLNPERAPAL